MVDLNDRLLLVLYWLWRMPWASAVQLADVTGFTDTSITMMLTRNDELVRRVWLGRGKERVFKYIFSPLGVWHMETAYKWKRGWPHTASALRTTFEQMEFADFCYDRLPSLPGSAMLGAQTSVTYPHRRIPGERFQVTEYEHSLKLVDLIWRPGDTLFVVSVYEAEDDPSLRIYLPVTYYSSYQRPADVRSWRAEMEKTLIPGKFWGDGPPDEEWTRVYARRRGQVSQHLEGYLDGLKGELCYPSLILVVPNAVIGLKCLRLEVNKDEDPGQGIVDIGVVDLSGQVMRPLKGVCVYWDEIRYGDEKAQLGHFEAMLVRVEESHWNAVNGEYEWRFFQWIHDYPGTGFQQILSGCGVDLGNGNPVARRTGLRILQKMLDAGLALEATGQYYLARQGLVVYAQSQGVHVTRVRNRLGKYSEKTSPYRELQAEHNLKVAQSAVTHLRLGVRVYSGIHTVWDYPDQTQLRPDLMALLQSGDGDWFTLVCIELERSARFRQGLQTKLHPYRILSDILEMEAPCAFITETEAAAKKVVTLADSSWLVAISWGRFEGPDPLWDWAALDVDEGDPFSSDVSFGHSLSWVVRNKEYPEWELILVPFFRV